MKRYWFDFAIENISGYPPGIGLGCGVTAYNYDDAIQILKEKLFKSIPIPAIIKCIENVDVNELDQGHVIPNMKSPRERGIWFPFIYE
ncbi:MAG: hypothetical protein J7578_24745 [Chitinophagaceae bacterium]|nr:hypothetical protein [Chitinophagaceae bacterium]